EGSEQRNALSPIEMIEHFGLVLVAANAANQSRPILLRFALDRWSRRILAASGRSGMASEGASIRCLRARAWMRVAHGLTVDDATSKPLISLFRNRDSRPSSGSPSCILHIR